MPALPARRLAVVLLALMAISSFASARQPNILWISSEDHGPQMGCYGDTYATTPNIDQLASRGLRYTHVWSNAPVCAPARTTIISGLYATSTGAEQMRSEVALPEGFRMFPQYLREAGYYCTNNAKEDYNLRKPGQVWDDSSAQAHWRNRSGDQPFFAVFNSTVSHESRLRVRPHEAVHDPALVRVPAYHPDTPEVRQDWAQYYDTVTQADAVAGDRLKELEEAGMSADTIVFYWGDHGSGMPRSKRFAGNSGLQVPLIIYIPEAFRDLRPPEYVAGGVSDRLVAFVDFAPTVLSLAGIQPPPWMQGEAFLGPWQTDGREFNYGFRGRMDERMDLVRSVTDGRFVYLRNYLPHLPHGQHVRYQFETPTTRIWKELFDQGALTPAQVAFWQPRPPEELYDLQSDPDEVINLAGSPAHQEVLKRFQRAHLDQLLEIRDTGFLPEGDRFERAVNDSPYALGHDPARYPLKQIYDMADLASSLDPAAEPGLVEGLMDSHSAIRYWAILGLTMRGENAARRHADSLRVAIDDFSPYVRIAAAEALGLYGDSEDRSTAVDRLLAHADGQSQNLFVVCAALNSLTALGPAVSDRADAIAALPDEAALPASRYQGYVVRLKEHLLETLQPHRKHAGAAH
ncbi:MAG: sulfatase-like hydrolase/transferase [Opitutaceae bacterium]